MVADPQVARRAHGKDFIRHLAGIFAIALAIVRQDRPDPDRIIDGRDPAACQFAVMRHDRGAVGPVHLWPWYQMPFKVVGVQFDQTGGKVIAAQIDRPFGHASPLGQIDDDAILDGQRSGDHLAF